MPVTHLTFLDIDECEKSHGPFGRCGENAICSNTPGAFSCQCKPGYSGNAFEQCIGKPLSFLSSTFEFLFQFSGNEFLSCLNFK
jgi:hypothetical protein